MLHSARLDKIMRLLKERKHMKINELSELLGVSEMTVHRDVKKLLQEGHVIKTFGGVSYADAGKAGSRGGNDCSFCGKPSHDRIAYRLILENQSVETACCCHCGILRELQLGDQVQQSICRDFLTDTTINARAAFYVVDTSFDMRCCKPQVVPFERQSTAEGFARGFGGTVVSFAEAEQVVSGRRHHANGNSCCESAIDDERGQ